MADQAQFSRPETEPIGVGKQAQNELDHTDGAYTEPPKVEGIARADASQQQFPSLAGYPGVEVLERSADVHGNRSTKKHRKVFVIFTAGLVFDVGSFDHAPNFSATRQYMLEHGLRPTGDVTFAGVEEVDGKNVALIYEVEAVPAAVAVDPATAHTIVSQD